MAKFRCNSINDPILNQIEWEGTPQELLAIFDGLKQRFGDTLQITSVVPKRYDIPRKAFVGATIGHLDLRPADYSELAQKMPTVEQLIGYILEKPKFQHDIVDIELAFFKKPIISRKYGRLYRELRTKLILAREAIETMKHGAFERRTTRPRNLQVYTFRPMTSVLAPPEPQNHPSS